MSSDPYSTSPAANYNPAAKLPPEGEAPKPQYFAALNYVFEHPEWAMSLLMGSVCMLIPILNSLIILGYRYEIVEMKVRFPDQLYPKFDFNRFSQYLTRGLWPFLIDFIVQFIINIPIQISVWIVIGVVGAASESESKVWVVVAGIGIPVLILMVLVFLIALHVLLVPITLRAGLSQDFGMTFNFPWIKDFLRKVGLQVLLFNLFLIPVGFVLGIAGYMACCFGVLPVAFFLMGPVLAHYHGQLYRMYLAKGGEPIPFKPLQLPPAYSLPAPVSPSLKTDKTPSMSIHRGGLGEPYCSEGCYNAGGKDIALANLHGYDGPCAFCQTPVRLGLGSGNLAHPFRKIFLYVCPGCRSRAQDHAAKIQECCFCGGSLP